VIDQQTFIAWLVIWIAFAALALWGQRRTGVGAGLTISYVVQLWMLHWLGAAIYALPWYETQDRAQVLGLEQSVYAIAGFALGCSILVPALTRSRNQIVSREWRGHTIDPKLARTSLAIGCVTYFGLEPILHGIPTVGAIASATSNLLLVALALECWNGLSRTGTRANSFWRWVILSATLPIITILTKGFLGYGFASMLTIFCFVASFYRPRWKIVAASLVIGYLALSLYVTYMRDRKDIRAVVWGGEAYATRLSAISRTFLEFEFLDIENIDHLERIDQRLNQNYLVGRSVQYLSLRPELFARGRTLWEAALSPIPRALWPDKPIIAGSGDLVSEFTGLRFMTGTSVGIGHVLEWYVNFGALGIFLGMLAMGTLVGWIDYKAAVRIHHGDARGFVLWWLPGLSLLQVGGSLVEAVGSAGAGLIIGLAIRSSAGTRSTRQQRDLPPIRSDRYPQVAVTPKTSR
jgi:hypothetical protein